MEPCKRCAAARLFLKKILPRVLNEIRTGLLEADVHFRVAKDFLARVKERCLREDVIKSLSPEEQILKVLSDELTQILGGHSRALDLSAAPPAVILMCGLQGSGKTTSTAKLGSHLKSEGKRVALVSVDVHRPAAMDQLKQIGPKERARCAQLFSRYETRCYCQAGYGGCASPKL